MRSVDMKTAQTYFHGVHSFRITPQMDRQFTKPSQLNDLIQTISASVLVHSCYRAHSSQIQLSESLSCRGVEMGLRTWTTAFFFLIVVVVMFPTLLHAQQLGCGGISPRVVLYQQSQPITTSFTVTGANSAQLQILLQNSSGADVGTINPTNNGNGNWSFSLNSSTLVLESPMSKHG
jgi:hypothetical protein